MGLREILGVVWSGSCRYLARISKVASTGGSKRQHLVRLPAYAPELNPAKGVWNLMKRGDLKNVCCRDLVQLRGLLKSAALRLANRPDLLHSCIQQPGCYA
jgi:transposase